MKKILTTGALALSIFFAISCEENMQESAAALNYRFVPVFASAETATRTVLQDDLSVTWEASDKINVFYDLDGSTSSAQYSASEAGASVQFDGSVPDGAEVKYAAYPYNADATLSGNVITTEIPAEQTAVPGSFGSGACVAAGKIDASGNVTMYNVCGLLKFTLTTSDITSILISGTSGECLAGKVTVTCGDVSVSSATDPLYSSPAVTFSNGGSPIPAGTYYVAVAPGSLAGIRLLFTRTDGKKALRYSTDPTAVSAGKIRTIGTIDAGLEYHATLTIPLHFREEDHLDDEEANHSAWPFTQAKGSSSKKQTTSFFTTTTGSYTISLNGAHTYYINSARGIQFTVTELENEDYWELPAIPNYKLISVSYRTGNGNSNPKVSTSSGDTVRGGSVKSDNVLNKVSSLYSWHLCGTQDNTPYRFVFGCTGTTFGITQLDMEYICTVESAVNSVSTLLPTHVTKSSAILNGRVNGVNAMSASEFDCLIEYRLKGGSEFVSVPVIKSETDLSFSAELSSLQAGATYEYRVSARMGEDEYSVSEVAEFATGYIDLMFYDGSFNNPFSSPSGFKTSAAATDGTVGNEIELITKEDSYVFKAFGSKGIFQHSVAGLGIGSEVGNYLSFPAIEGKRLTRVGLISGIDNTLGGSPSVCPAGSSTPVNGGEALGVMYQRGEWYEWNLSGTDENTAYRFYFNTANAFYARRLVLTYE